MTIETTAERIDPRHWRGLVWDVDEETGARLCLMTAYAENEVAAREWVLRRFRNTMEPAK